MKQKYWARGSLKRHVRARGRDTQEVARKPMGGALQRMYESSCSFYKIITCKVS